MNKKFLYGMKLITLAGLVAVPAIASGAVKLPYEKGQEFVVVQGYNSPPTHINKDAYAIDFSQNGCDAYGKTAVASAGGVVILAKENGYNGGYGTQVLIDEGNHIVARYAHMIPGTIPFAVGATIVQGQAVGAIGNTGLVAGAACAIHPGTHLHFAMYYENSDGSFAAVSPEPISGYRDITEGRWYLSDNEIDDDADNNNNSSADISADIAAAIANPIPVPSPTTTTPTTTTPTTTTVTPVATTVPIAVASSVAPVATILPTTTASTNENETSTATTTTSSSGSNGGGGGITVSQSPEQLPAPTSTATSTASAASSTPSYAISFDSSTLAIDLSWQATQAASSTSASDTSVASSSTAYAIYKVDPADASNTVEVATTTSTSYSYVLAPNDFGITDYFVIYVLDADGSIATGTGSTVAFASTTAPAWFTTVQPVDTDNSNGSWYDDNWYDLGTGFYGLVRSLTLEGSIDNSSYFKSHLYLDEYLDPNYTELNQTWTISDNAPFTDSPQKITINGLAIPLQPNKYYRLRTYQDYQNRSVILAGTSATGTAMWDEYIYGTGVIRNIYSFYPYLAGVIIPNYPPLAAPNPPANMTTSFDTLNSVVNFSWSPATDPDTTSSLLTYQWNVASGTVGGVTPVFDPGAWQSVGGNFSASIPVVFGNTYMIGIRAIDDFGNVGTPLITPWNFPDGYYPAPEQLDHSVVVGYTGGAQKIVFNATTTVSSIIFWVAANGYTYCCSESSVSVHSDMSGSSGDAFASSSVIQLSYRNTGAPETYTFSPKITLSPGAYWFSLDKDYGSQDTSIAGSTGDSYPDGEWSTSPGQDAYFMIAE